MNNLLRRQLVFRLFRRAVWARVAAIIVAAISTLALGQMPMAYAADPHNGKPCGNEVFVDAHPKYCKKLKRAHPIQPDRPDPVLAVDTEIR
jgi:hypothetical protein